LPARYVLHTVGPVYKNAAESEPLLKLAYQYVPCAVLRSRHLVPCPCLKTVKLIECSQIEAFCPKSKRMQIKMLVLCTVGVCLR
jgi:O-acetyl-ADP-ribose deacetylase (regulator of RNase III)